MADKWGGSKNVFDSEFEGECKKQKHPTKEKEHKHLIICNREFKSLKQVIERKAWLPRQQDKDKLIRRRC